MDEKRAITDEEWKIVKFRMLSMPSTIKLYVGGSPGMTKDDIIIHLSNRDEMGELIVRMQMHMIQSFKKM